MHHWRFALVYILFLAFNSSFCQHTRVDRPRRKGFGHFDKIIVISLAKRQDRRAQIKQELGKVGVQTYDVFDGIEIVPPCPLKRPLGTSLSHILALQKCKDARARTCLILEDDFTLIADSEDAKVMIDKLFTIIPSAAWDVVSLASSVVYAKNTTYSFLRKIYDSQTLSGYVVNNHYYNTLIETFTSSAWLFNEGDCSIDHKNMFAVDMFMKHRQPFGNWFVFEPRLGKQRQSFSDLEQALVDYDV